MLVRIVIILLFIVLSAGESLAEDKTTASDNANSPWAGKFSIGYNESTGDTAFEGFMSNFETTYKTDKWNNSVEASSLFRRNDERRTAERFSLTGEANFYLNEDTFVFARTDNTYNYFSAFDITLSNSMGFGKRLIHTNATTLDVQIGPGDLRQRDADTKEFSDELTLFFKETFKWQITKITSLSHYISINYGSPNTHIEGKVALNTAIVGAWGLALSYNFSHDTYLPPNSTNTHKTDTFTAVTVSYTF